jgi:hypothetical protein
MQCVVGRRTRSGDRRSFLASLQHKKRRGSGGSQCVISMPAMSATFSNLPFCVCLPAQTGRSASHGTTRRETTDARMDGTSNGAMRRRGVCLTRNYTRGLRHSRNAALLRLSGRRSGRLERCFIASQYRPVASAAHGQRGNDVRLMALTSCFSIQTTVSARKPKSTRPSRKFGCSANPDAPSSSSPFPAEARSTTPYCGSCMSGWRSKRMPKTSSRCERTYPCPGRRDHAPTCNANAGLRSSNLMPN